MNKEGQRDEVATSVGFLCGLLSVLAPVGILFLFIYGPFLGILLGILGLVFGLKQSKRNKSAWTTWAITLSVIGLILSVLALVSLVQFASNLADQLAALQSSGQLAQFEQFSSGGA